VHGRSDDASEWKKWRNQGVLPMQGQTWFDLLRDSTVPEAVTILTKKDYSASTKPIVYIDEFGLDLGGQTDRKTAAILRASKGKMPELGIVVWQMRGPIAPVLASAYRDVVNLVCMEAYLNGAENYWKIAGQATAAKLQGLADKAVVGLGLGAGGRNKQRPWANTKKELGRQVRFVRMVAPRSPGLAFFSPNSAKNGEAGLLKYASELCNRFSEIPTDGRGLPERAKEIGRIFQGNHDKPMLIGSGHWVEPNRAWTNPSNLVKPKTMNATILNVGKQPARHVRVRLRNRSDKGGKVFAEGVVNVPARSVATAVLPVTGKWKSWKDWPMEIEPPSGDSVVFPRKK
jgi:hypothetical protein